MTEFEPYMGFCGIILSTNGQCWFLCVITPICLELLKYRLLMLYVILTH